jgi:hypothetical protein
MDPTLNEIQREKPNVDTVHFFSDGPSVHVQYRHKGNVFLFSIEIANRYLNLATWNFHESGHGKGAPDGVGAAIKRSADFKALHGQDIISAKSFIDQIKEKHTAINVFRVTQKEIHQTMVKLTSVETLPETLKIHQIRTSSHREI